MATNKASMKSYARTKHWVQLKELGYIGASMAQINAIERRAHQLAENICNIPMSEATRNRREQTILDQVTHVFGGELPKGFYLNLDPRGYALKLDNEVFAAGTMPISYIDWGGYGILAPEF